MPSPMDIPAVLTLDNEQLYRRLQEEKARRLQAEQALQHATEELARLARITSMGEFAASIAHEVNQPLAAMVLHAEVGFNALRQDPPQTEQARDALKLIMHIGASAGDVIRSIRGMSSKTGPVPTWFAVDEALREVLRLLRAELHKHGIDVRDGLALGEHQLYADRVQLQQVMMNLVLNAIEAMKDVHDRPRKLELSSALADISGTLRISVEDNGVGVSAKLAERLFDPLFSTKPGGTGLGLSICRTIIHAHGGRIWSTSRQPHGTAFHISLKGNTPWTPSPS
ncbi:MAG TPA: ATP-binding protein [Duganella sp.]|uniref:sensor histidine kinase n=1 Tax=Duganella sp. TaxID=1904440 RepID=UPI002ED6358D